MLKWNSDQITMKKCIDLPTQKQAKCLEKWLCKPMFDNTYPTTQNWLDPGNWFLIIFFSFIDLYHFSLSQTQLMPSQTVWISYTYSYTFQVVTNEYHYVTLCSLIIKKLSTVYPS